MKLEDFINQLRYEFQMQSKNCFVANDDFWMNGCWDIYTKKDNKFIGQVFFILDSNCTLNDVLYNQDSKNVLTEVVKAFDSAELYHDAYIQVDDNGIHF